jgi:hypothetical protein
MSTSLDEMPATCHSSPLRKRFRRDSANDSSADRLAIQPTPGPTISTHPNNSDTVPSLSTTTSPEVGSLGVSLAKIKDQAHANRLTIQQQLVEDEGTEEAYTQHVKNYLSFWSSFQDQKVKEEPQWARIPAHPITGDKVAIFLQHETTRNKVHYYFAVSNNIFNIIWQRDHHGNEISGTSVGKNSIAQCISALQSYINEHQHNAEYQNSTEVHILLRNQPCVKTFEKAACANEPTRVSKAHVVKSKGTISGESSMSYFLKHANIVT